MIRLTREDKARYKSMHNEVRIFYTHRNNLYTLIQRNGYLPLIFIRPNVDLICVI